MSATSIVIVAPLRPTSGSGNDVTAQRWANHFTDLGYRVTLVATDEAAGPMDTTVATALERADLLVAIHARRTAPAIRWWAERVPERPLVVALSGTDLYRDMPDNSEAMTSVAVADHLIVLQQDAVDRLGSFKAEWALKTSVVHQSVPRPLPPRRPAPGELRVVVLAHLREVKDPLLAARAARHLPESSLVTVHHAGRAYDQSWHDAAATEESANPRYHWHRELPRSEALALLASGHVLACTSLAEGGANVVTEAIAVGVPVIGTRIDGNTGLLGHDHPGLTPVGDVAALADLLRRLESDLTFRAELQQRTDRLQPITDPSAERRALGQILDRLSS